jgi:hypothetical protein
MLSGLYSYAKAVSEVSLRRKREGKSEKCRSGTSVEDQRAVRSAIDGQRSAIRRRNRRRRNRDQRRRRFLATVFTAQRRRRFLQRSDGDGFYSDQRSATAQRYVAEIRQRSASRAISDPRSAIRIPSLAHVAYAHPSFI